MDTYGILRGTGANEGKWAVWNTRTGEILAVCKNLSEAESVRYSING